MIKLVLSVRDSVAGVFRDPFVTPTIGVAYRELMDVLAKPSESNVLASHPADFELFQLGSFDDATGVFTPELKLVVSIADLVQTRQ